MQHVQHSWIPRKIWPNSIANWIPVHELRHLRELELRPLLEQEQRRQAKHYDDIQSVLLFAFASSNKLRKQVAILPLRGLHLPHASDTKLARIIQELRLDEGYSLQSLIIRYFTLGAP